MDDYNKTAIDYLKEPYSRVLMPDGETGTFAAKIEEFPGCFAQGDTPEKAYRNLEAAAESWIEEVLATGRQVPEPAVNNQYSGRVALRLPKSLHRNAAQMAERDNTSLNQFLVSAIAEKIGAGNLYENMIQDLDSRLDQIAENSVTRAINLSNVLSPLGGTAVTVNVVTDNTSTQKWPRLTLASSPGNLAVAGGD